MKRIKNKLQQKIKTIKTVFIRMLCVSLKPMTENNLCENEKIGKFEENINFEKNKRIMASIEIIGNRLVEKLDYLKDNPLCINEIVKDINSYRDNDGILISDEIKKKIISEIDLKIGTHLQLLIEDQSAKRLRELLQQIKDKLNVK